MNDIKPKNTKTIDIKEFILSREFNPILFERTYHVTPDTKHAPPIRHTYSILSRVN